MPTGPTPIVVGQDTTSLQGLGTVERMHDPDTGCWYDRELLYNATGGATVANACYVKSYSGTVAQNPQAIVAAAVAAVPRTMAVALEAIASGGYGWFAIRGTVTARCDGTTDIAAGDYLKLAPGTDADAMIKDGTSETASSVAIAREAFTTNANGNVKVFLLGELKVINT